MRERGEAYDLVERLLNEWKPEEPFTARQFYEAHGLGSGDATLWRMLKLLCDVIQSESAMRLPIKFRYPKTLGATKQIEDKRGKRVH